MLGDNAEITLAGNLVSVKFNNYSLPTFQMQKGKEWIKAGEDNNYFDYLLELYHRHAEHGAITSGKAHYIYGKGVTYNPEGLDTIVSGKLNLFLLKANRYESLNEVYRKNCLALSLFNGFALQIIWSVGKQIAEIYHMELSKLRVGKDKDKIYYCDNWIRQDGTRNSQPESDPTFKEFDVFNPNTRSGTQILYYVCYTPTSAKYGSYYPIADYQNCVSDIETDVEITNFHRSNVKGGFAPSSILSFFNGEPNEDTKKKLVKLIKKNYSGSDNAGNIIFNFVNKGGTKAEVTTLQANDLDKQFEILSERIQQKVFTGHGVTNPGLFGIQTAGKLGTRNELIEAFELWQNTYIIQRQDIILEVYAELAKINGVAGDLLEVKQSAPIGVDYTDPNISKYLTTDEVREKLGFEPLQQGQSTPANPTPTATPTLDADPVQINDTLKSLTAKEHAQIMRIVRQYTKKQNGMTREIATTLLKSGFGLNDEEINLFLGQDNLDEGEETKALMAKVTRDKSILEIFEFHAVEDNEDEIVSEDFVTFKTGKDAFMFEATKQDEGMVLDILKGNPDTTPEQIAKQLGLTVDEVLAILAGLITAGLIMDNYTPTEKGANKPTPQVETQVYTVYKYAVRYDVPKAKKSREFCQRLMQLSNEGKRWTREAIDNITATVREKLSMPEFDVWTYRGGFYNNPDEGITPFCRHIFVAITKVKSK